MFESLVPLLLLAQPAFGSESVKTIRLCDSGVAIASISPKGSVLDFPANPEKVVLGTRGAFTIEYIRNDLIISPSTLNSRSNLFVYLQGRRFSIDLVTSPSASTLYFIRDCENDKVISGKKNGKQK